MQTAKAIAAALLIVLCINGTTAVPRAQEAPDTPDLAELWRVGCLWQVGDNVQKVADARQALIEAGKPGLDYAISRLSAGATLEIRCLTAVIVGFGEDAIEPLSDNIDHESPAARRNAADLLLRVNGRSGAEALLAQAQVEENSRARLSQLTALARWEVAESLTPLLELSSDDNHRVRMECCPLLNLLGSVEAGERLLEMLHDRAFFVRNSARRALVTARLPVRLLCLRECRTALEGGDATRARRLLPVVATLAVDDNPALLLRALNDPESVLRANAAEALVTWKTGAGLLDETTDVKAELAAAARQETDPFTRGVLDEAIENLERKLNER